MRKETETIGIIEAAEILGVTANHLRKALAQKIYPFGVVLNVDNGKKRKQYVIYRAKLNAWLEKEVC